MPTDILHISPPPNQARNFQKPGLKLPALNANATLTRLRRKTSAVLHACMASDNSSHLCTHMQDATELLLDLSFPSAPHLTRGAPVRARLFVFRD